MSDLYSPDNIQGEYRKKVSKLECNARTNKRKTQHKREFLSGHL